MEKTAAVKIKEMAAAEDGSQIPGFAEVIVEQAHGEEGYGGDRLALQLARLEQHSQFTPELNTESSRWGGSFIKRLFGKMARAVLKPVFQQQSMYNMEVASSVWAMKEEMDRSQKQIQERLRQLEEEVKPGGHQ